MIAILEESVKFCKTGFEILGVATFAYVFAKVAYKLATNVSMFVFNIGGVNFRKYGEWAVVTGCTDGIGKAYAEYFAKIGLNVVLISRNLDKLNQQANELSETFKVSTKVIAADFTQNTIYPRIKTILNDLDIGVLVNNVGLSYEYPDFFHNFASDPLTSSIDEIINVNIMGCTKMTAIVLPGMLRKRKGIIINNASASGRVPLPLLTIYSATKAYMAFFSRCLKVEYAPKGIIVQSLCPYFVSTKLARVDRAFLVPNPLEYVSSAVKTVGVQDVTNGCFMHNLQGFVYENCIPDYFYYNGSMKLMLGQKKRYLKERSSKDEADKQKELKNR